MTVDFLEWNDRAMIFRVNGKERYITLERREFLRSQPWKIIDAVGVTLGDIEQQTEALYFITKELDFYVEKLKKGEFIHIKHPKNT